MSEPAANSSPPATATPLLDVVDLKKHFPIYKGVFSRLVGQVHAVDGVSFKIARGETVVAMGFPLHGTLSSQGNVTVGTISALAGYNDDFRELQFSAPIQPGNSGGPLIDRSGHVVGIVSSELVSEIAEEVPQNVNFAIKAEIVIALQTMITRRFNATEATVLTIGKIEAGTTNNVIPDTCYLLGTIRTLSPERRQAMKDALHEVAVNIARAHRCEAEIQITPGFPPTMNDARAVALGEAVALSLGGEEPWHTRPAPTMGAEDFSYVLEQVPGAMFFLGVAAEGVDWKGCCGLHSSHMVLDENVMPKGSAFLAGCALRFLDKGWA